MKTEMTIEEIMHKAGFLRTERENCGKIYVEYIRDGIIIDEEDIFKDKQHSNSEDD